MYVGGRDRIRHTDKQAEDRTKRDGNRKTGRAGRKKGQIGMQGHEKETGK